MLEEEVEKLKRQYTDQYVVVDAGQPELARFKNMVGQIITVNMNGRALVQFDADNNRGWYDIALAHLTTVEKPAPKEKPAAKPTAKRVGVAKQQEA
jgi:hypothetical protein